MKFREDLLSCTGLLAGLFVLAGCGGSGSSAGSETGFLSLGVSDGPVHDAEKVCITFDSIEFKPAGDEQSFVVDLDPVEKVNLLDFQGANAAPILEREELPDLIDRARSKTGRDALRQVPSDGNERGIHD